MRVLVLYCHPNPDSLVSAACGRAVDGLRTGAHDVRLTDLYADRFEPSMTPDERRTHKIPGVSDSLQQHVDDLAWAEALVFVYPTWWSGQPAMLKGWIDRIFVAGVAWSMDEGTTKPAPLLRNVRRIVAVTTHGSPKWLNALEGESGKRTLFRAIRAMCSRRTRTTWCAMYGVDRADESTRAAFLDKVERTLASL